MLYIYIYLYTVCLLISLALGRSRTCIFNINVRLEAWMQRCVISSLLFEEPSVGYRMKYDRDGSLSFLVASAMASVRPQRAGCHFNTGLRSV